MRIILMCCLITIGISICPKYWIPMFDGCVHYISSGIIEFKDDKNITIYDIYKEAPTGKTYEYYYRYYNLIKYYRSCILSGGIGCYDNCCFESAKCIYHNCIDYKCTINGSPCFSKFNCCSKRCIKSGHFGFCG